MSGPNGASLRLLALAIPLAGSLTVMAWMVLVRRFREDLHAGPILVRLAPVAVWYPCYFIFGRGLPRGESLPLLGLFLTSRAAIITMLVRVLARVRGTRGH